jgi:hypothetical protein
MLEELLAAKVLEVRMLHPTTVAQYFVRQIVHVFEGGQPRTPQIKREFRRHATIEPVIGHLKAEHRIRP